MVRLRRVAVLAAEVEHRSPAPYVALDSIEQWTGRLSDRELPDRDPEQGGAFSVRPGDVLFGKLRPYLAKSWLVDREVLASSELLAIRPTAHALAPRYLAYVVQSRAFVEWAAATSDGTKMPRTSWEDLREYALRLPPITEQAATADYLDAVTAQIDALIGRKRRMIGLLEEREFGVLSSVLAPQETPVVRLRFLATLQTGLTVDAKREAGPSAVVRPYLRVANVQPGWLELDSVTEIEVPAELANRCTLRYGDVLMTEGGDLDKLGRGTMWRDQLPGALHQNHVFVVRPLPDRLDPEFLALLTRTYQARAYFESTGTRTTNLASTNSAKILDLPVPALSIEVQRRLVAQATGGIDRLGRIRGMLGRQIGLLTEHRQALITAAVTGETDVREAVA